MTKSNDLMKTVSKCVRFYRYNNNLTPEETGNPLGKLSQEKMAEMANVSVALVSALESENTDKGISIKTLQAISEALKIPAYAFFLEKPIKNPPENPFEN